MRNRPLASVGHSASSIMKLLRNACRGIARRSDYRGGGSTSRRPSRACPWPDPSPGPRPRSPARGRRRGGPGRTPRGVQRVAVLDVRLIVHRDDEEVRHVAASLGLARDPEPSWASLVWIMPNQSWTFAPAMGVPVSRSRTVPSTTRPVATDNTKARPLELVLVRTIGGQEDRLVPAVGGREDHRERLLDRAALDQQQGHPIPADPRHAEPAVGIGRRGTGALGARDEGVSHLAPERGIHPPAVAQLADEAGREPETYMSLDGQVGVAGLRG